MTKINRLSRFRRLPPYFQTNTQPLGASIGTQNVNRGASDVIPVTISVTEHIVRLNFSPTGSPGAGAPGITYLPTGSNFVDGDTPTYVIKHVSASAGQCLLSATGGDRIDGNSTYYLYPSGSSASIMWDGSGWNVF